MPEIIWSPKAEAAYLAILETTYYFSTAAALELDEKLEKLLKRLKKHNHLCPPTPTLPGLRRCVITKNVSLVYALQDSDIHIVLVIDNRMENLL
ncbi:MAG: type II toxin-antitoxin system RelE/ParE family toxin [Lewinellaceae bacterium]|nr:type II toxin-antitoxin system RelE/ParE family toxin [Lewinellaceae bacterium]MCB9331517.1 type II toxin-antitoxin system RelE/ParE family toxin [Lewinellaceae bacterium]